MTKKYLLHLFDYNRSRGILIWKNKTSRFCNVPLGSIAGTMNNTGYYQIKIKQRLYRTHQLIWIIENGRLPKQIDHTNGNKKDNRIKNLRATDNRGNQQNQKRHRRGKLVGAHWNKNKGLWYSSIKIKKRQIYLGRFSSELKAHLRYKEELQRRGL